MTLLLFAGVLLRNAVIFLYDIIQQPESYFTNKMLFLLIVAVVTIVVIVHWTLRGAYALLKYGIEKMKEEWQPDIPALAKVEK